MMRPRNVLLLYFAMAFAISWTGFVLGFARDELYLLLAAMVLGPAGTSIVLTAALEGRRGLRELAQRLTRWRVGARWYAMVLVAPALLVVVLGALSLSSPDFVPIIVKHPAPAEIVLNALAIGLTAGIFEEIGWTGFVTPRLLRRRSWFTAGVILGVPWALWHALPDYLARPMTPWIWIVHIIEWIVALAAFRVLMTWIYSRTNSLLVAMLLHVSFTGGQSLLWPAGPPASELMWYGLFAVGLWIVVAIVVRERIAQRLGRGGVSTSNGRIISLSSCSRM